VEVSQIKGSLNDLTDNLERLRQQLRDIELQAETQMSSRLEAAKAAAQSFDPLEFDRFTRFQELTRMMAESVNDVATVQRTLQRTLESTEDELAAQARLTRDLQDDLLRTRMVEFEGLSDRLYRVVRQAAKETGKQVRLDIVGGSIEVDRGVLDRMTGAFEHLLRNSVTHGIESPERRTAAGKDATGSIIVSLSHEGNEVGVEFRDDGAGLDLNRIRDKGLAMRMLEPGQTYGDGELANLIFTSGFSTADKVTELAGRGIGMDVVRAEVNAMGGRIETATAAGQGTSFKLVLPLTTAVTQVVMLRVGEATVAVPSTLVEIVRRARAEEIDEAYLSGQFTVGDRALQFFWLGSLLQLTPRSAESAQRTRQVVIIRSAQQRIAIHVDEVLGNHEVVVKNLGPQLSRMPGLAGMTLLASGSVALIYNPVALATLYGAQARGGPGGARAPPGQRGHGGRAARTGARGGAAGGRDRPRPGPAGAGGRRLADGAPRHAAAAGARRLPRGARQGRSRCAGTARRGEAVDGAVGHRDAAHGRLRPGAQHPRRRPPARPAGDHDHLAHRPEAPRLRRGARRRPLSREAVLGRGPAGPDRALHRRRPGGLTFHSGSPR
jgi:chemosensory pili system protein ChpA (sensor histidine kinase/response regulator)